MWFKNMMLAGTVIAWDTGSYSSKDTLSEQLKEGKISIELYGNKLKGLFSLIRTKRENQWLLDMQEQDLTMIPLIWYSQN